MIVGEPAHERKQIEKHQCDFCYKYNAYIFIPTLEGSKKACIYCEKQYFSRPLSQNESKSRNK